jgi:cytochrome c553
MRPAVPSSLALAIFLAAPAVAAAQAAVPDDEPRLEFFERKVRPILVNNCYNCHSANTNSKGGLRVDDRNGLIHGGERGPAVVPGDPEKSLLIQAVRHIHPEVKMPPMKYLADDEIADLTQWIKDGAAWPKVNVELPSGDPDPEYARLRREHWAWQPLRKPRTRQVNDASWPTDDIDHFVLATLEAKRLAPVGDAPPLTLVRRLNFDLAGLPPGPDEAEAFVAAWEAADPDSRRLLLERLVDRLLASPAFGERWGRQWLDVARFGESTGSARNIPYPQAWRYRDYVIDAFNSDKPYDQFLREQIAGDLLPAESQQQRDEHLIATGFLALGVCDVNQRFKVRFVMDNIDEQIDTVARAVLGLTVSCARCHDHKFDPIPLTDYYALAGIFHSSQRCAGVRNKMGGGGLDYYDTAMLLRLGSRPVDEGQIAQQVEQVKAELAKARAHMRALQDDPDQSTSGADREKELAAARQRVAKLQNEILALSDPAARGPVALGVRDAPAVGDTEIRVRGEAEQLGPVVARGFLSVFDVPGAPKVNPAQSGRLELAEWLVSRHNPLTPRVMANRVWQHLFGRGLVGTVDNFGVTGDVPSHPELLDHLAIRFMENGWSVKKLVRAIVLSRAYQLGFEAPPAHVTADPDNRLVWRHSPRRLEAEEIRDAMLAAAGQLDLNRPEGSPAKDFKVVELRSDGPEAARLAAQCLNSPHRSIYLPLLRGLTPHALAVFDFAEQGMVTGSRDTTTVATQALYLLNDPLVRQQSQALADRLMGQSGLDDAERTSLLYRLALCRPATAGEIERATSYLDEYETAARREDQPPAEPRTAAWASLCQAILASAEFRYVR